MKFRFAWAPPLLAAIILAFGIRSFLRGYPGGKEPAGNGGRPPTRDSLLPEVLRRFAAYGDTSGFRADSVPVPDPFRTRVRRAAAGAAKPVKPIPRRKWKLKGTAGNAVATLLDSAGNRHLLRAGDSLGGARVLAVHANRVLMQDADGPFELELEQ